MADDIERRSLYPMPLPPRIAGRLSTMAQPYPDRLYEQFCALRSNGVDVMVSLQPAAERQAAGLEGEPAAAVRAGLEFHEVPVVDFGVPDRAVAAPVMFESTDAAALSTTFASLEDDAATPAVPMPGPVESGITAATNDVPSLPTVVQPVSHVGGGYGFGEWTDSHTIPAVDEIMGGLPEQPVAPVLESLGDAAPTQAEWTGHEAPESPEPSPRELVEGNEESQPDVDRNEPQPAGVTAVPTVEAYSPHDARIAAAFDRLADRVRSREIDVSSIAPEATDAAVLASVLAALLGGSRSR